MAALGLPLELEMKYVASQNSSTSSVMNSRGTKQTAERWSGPGAPAPDECNGKHMLLQIIILKSAFVWENGYF